MPSFVRLLGRLGVQHEGEWHELPTDLPSTLLYYLAYHGSWVSREQLAFLFWSDSPEANARRNLRNLVLRVKALPYAQDLEIERNRLRWQVETDAQIFKQAVSENSFEKAIELYRDELLTGFRLDNALEFSDWLELERAELAKLHQDAVLNYLTELEKQEAYAKAAELLEPLRKADPFDETLLRRQLKNLQASQQFRQAVSTFEQFENSLDKEFGAEPELATIELLESAQQTAPVSSAKQVVTPPLTVESETTILNNLPGQLTPFIGREIERRRIAEQLTDPDCRLLTLVAPGGMGKTSLALAIAREHLERFKDGVWFVPLAAVADAEQMLFAITDALTLFPTQDPKAQLLSHLEDKDMLLLLDNLEHLSELTLISEMLASASKLKILATSRAQLRLRAEWLFDLSGLDFPQEDAVSAETYDAVELFLQTANRLVPDPGFEASDLQVIGRICRLVAGMPLAIELAASWLRILAPEDIAGEIMQSLDVLETSAPDMPERHQSIRAVFDYSWQLLTPKQQQTLAKLTIFKGGFDRHASVSILKLSTRELLELVSKSLLQRDADGRFNLHPLIHFYASEKLAANDLASLSINHARYYAELLKGLVPALPTSSRNKALAVLMKEDSNILAAWQHITQEGSEQDIDDMVQVFFEYYIESNRYQEGLSLFDEAEAQLSLVENTPVALKVKARRAVLLARVSNFEKARNILETCLERSQDIAERSFIQESLADFVYYWLGDFEKAAKAIEVAHASYQKTQDKKGLARTFYSQGTFAWHKGDYAESERLIREGQQLFSELGYTLWHDNCQFGLATLAYETGNYANAEIQFKQLLESLKSQKQNHVIASTQSNLGLALAAQGEHEESLKYYGQALAHFETLGDKPWLSEVLFNIGQAKIADR